VAPLVPVVVVNWNGRRLLSGRCRRSARRRSTTASWPSWTTARPTGRRRWSSSRARRGLARPAARLGLCASAPEARALHLGSASSGWNGPRKRFLLGRNQLWVSAKCYPGDGLRRYIAALVLYDAAALAAYAPASPPGVVDQRHAGLRSPEGLPGCAACRGGSWSGDW